MEDVGSDNNKINPPKPQNQNEQKEDPKENQKSEETKESEDNPAPSASVFNLNLNLKKSSIDFSKIFSYIKGDITTVKADVIVNSSSPNMVSNNGRIKKYS